MKRAFPESIMVKALSKKKADCDLFDQNPFQQREKEDAVIVSSVETGVSVIM